MDIEIEWIKTIHEALVFCDIEIRRRGIIPTLSVIVSLLSSKECPS